MAMTPSLDELQETMRMNPTHLPLNKSDTNQPLKKKHNTTATTRTTTSLHNNNHYNYKEAQPQSDNSNKDTNRKEYNMAQLQQKPSHNNEQI